MTVQEAALSEASIESTGDVSEAALAYIQSLDVPGDAQTEPDPPAETDADEAASPDEPTETAATKDTWIDDEVKELASLYGVSDEKLAKLTNRDEFEKFTSLYEDRLINAGRKLLEPAQPNQAASAPESKPTEPAPAAQQAPLPVELQDVLRKVEAIRPDDYGTELTEAIGGVTNFVRQQHAVIGQLVQYVQEQVRITQEQTQQIEMQRQIDQFNTLVTGLGHKDLFGEDLESATPEMYENRKQVLNTLIPLLASISQESGRSVPISKALVKRAANAVFADKFVEQARRETTDKIRQQSGKRLGGATRKPQFPSRPLPKSGDLRDDPEHLSAVRSILDRPPSDD
jgi:hypothetical protein